MSVAKNLSRVCLASALVLFVIYTVYSTARAGWLPLSVPQVPTIVSFLAILLMSVLFGTSIFIEGEVIPQPGGSAYDEAYE